ncbi:GntR family transcriptional regulator [Actinomadura sp. DC4]|uniref:winged helix-turn-helix domain-containing protein n=1 Tax=Actinomadura sp. DC4 TaxID=3055069 RepID=UPI0025B25FCB|nr:GntR family transcriptional regulator [Actinomadura sp. DC4]MDN3358915.1 GntR family transcriptional regulator [Actinomadura sp. DC4]
MDELVGKLPSGWVRLPMYIAGVPVWQRRADACYVATHDMDQLHAIAAALDRIETSDSRQAATYPLAKDGISSKPHDAPRTPPSTLVPTTAERNHVARPKSSDAVYLKIAAALRDRIHAGDLKPGDKLPSEAAVSTEFGVARGTAREALKKLGDDGLVDTLPGVGRVVRTSEPADATPRYRRIAAELIAAIEAGEYPPGSQLPGESQLAEQFQASRNTIRSALGELDGRGLVQVVHGRGRIVLPARTI